jgi:hypothetical protein
MEGDFLMADGTGPGEGGFFGGITVNSRTLAECPNYPLMPADNAIIVKTDRVLSEILIETNVEADITLPEPALEIKRIGKTVKIKQCELLLNTNKLFISGYVTKNIEYATFESFGTAGRTGPTGPTGPAGTAGSIGPLVDVNIGGYIKHCTVQVPFECTTAIPVIPSGGPTVAGQFDFNLENLKNKKILDKKEFVTVSFLNELPTCEAIAAVIIDEEIMPKGTFLFYPADAFQEFTEKMVIILQVKILQKQQVPIFQPQPTPSNIMEQVIEKLR